MHGVWLRRRLPGTLRVAPGGGAPRARMLHAAACAYPSTPHLHLHVAVAAAPAAVSLRVAVERHRAWRDAAAAAGMARCGRATQLPLEGSTCMLDCSHEWPYERARACSSHSQAHHSRAPERNTLLCTLGCASKQACSSGMTSLPTPCCCSGCCRLTRRCGSVGSRLRELRARAEGRRAKVMHVSDRRGCMRAACQRAAAALLLVVCADDRARCSRECVWVVWALLRPVALLAAVAALARALLSRVKQQCRQGQGQRQWQQQK